MKYLISCILLSGLFLNLNINAQISQGGTPLSFIYELSDDYELREYPAPDISKLIIEDSDRGKNGEIYRIGVSVPINAGLDNAGKWTEIPNKGRVWRFMIKAENAKALGVYFDKFNLPQGSKLFLYNYDKSQIIGAYTEINNHESDLFATELIDGDVVTLEYFEPLNCTEKAIINISEVSYVYRGYTSFKDKDYGDADDCLININCSEGTNWQDQKKGVARILLKIGSSYGWCSGSLVNNVKQDCKPYFLTADHCGTGASTSDFNQWVFYFHYESSNCSNAQPSGAKTMTGATLKARGGNGGSTGSDFILLQLNSSVPTSYNVYYNGWSNLNSATSSGVTIHHPMGDIKKISTFTSTPSTSGWNSSGLASHWKVTWAQTTNGRSVTEGGSSGSPLFNSNGLIMGDLTGGSSYCDYPENTYPDYYGKFSYSWSSNGTTAATRLKNWLDPDNTGATTLQGFYCGSTPPPPPPPTGSCDTVTNIQDSDQLTLYAYQQTWGTWTGHSGYGDDKFADFHSGTTQNTKLQGIYLAVAKAHAANTSSKISIKAWNSGSLPGSQLASKDVLINSLDPGYWNYVPFTSPVTVGSNFYVGYQIYYNSADTFAVYNAANRSSGVNTAFAYEDNAWHNWSEWSMYSSLGIFAVVCPVSTDAVENFDAENDILLFPNPSNGKFYIDPFIENNDNLNIVVYNNLGNEILRKTFVKPSPGPLLLDLPDVEPGIYFVQMQAGKKFTTRKISIIK